MTSVEIYPLQDKDKIGRWQKIETDNPKTTFNADELTNLCRGAFGRDDLERWLQTSTYIVVLREGTNVIKGFALILVNGYYVYINLLCVGESGKKYGETLLDTIKSVRKDRGIQLTATEKSKNFYIRHGFVEKTDRGNVMEIPAPPAETKGGKSRKRKTRRRKTFRLSRKKY